MRVDSASLASINVLANDTDADSNPLTVTIEEQPFVGSAVANPDGTVRLEALPGDFKGITKFRYRVTDPGGLSSSATAVVFVGVEPFRSVFAGDASSNGSYEVYLTDFASAPAVVTTATEGTMRLHGFSVSANGATAVYRRTSTSTPATSDLSFVRTSTPRQDVRIALPAGVALVADAAPGDQYKVSDDGNWIALVARDGLGADAAYVLNVANPSALNKVSIPGTVRVANLKFGANSQLLYLLASTSTSGTNRDLFAVSLDNLAVGRVSAQAAAASADDVLDYSVSPDQSRILLHANRGGREGLYFVDASSLQNEVRVSHQLGLLDKLVESTLSLPPGAGGSANGSKVAYTVQNLGGLGGFSTWIADVSATPNPRQIGSNNARAIGFRPDDAALLYLRWDNSQIYEATLDGSVSDQLVGAGYSAQYDSTGNIVLLKKSFPTSPTTSYPALASVVRGSFGTAQPIGTPGLAARFTDTTGFDRAVVITGEGPTTGTPPTTARLNLVNAMAPDRLLPLSDFLSPIQLATPAAAVVGN